jgi:Flp pilus assembly protein TadD
MKKIIPVLIALCVLNSIAFAEQIMREDAILSFNEGVKQQLMGNYANAAAAYQKAVFMNPGPEIKKRALNNLGAMLAKDGDFQGAHDAFLQAIDIDPGYKSPLANLGYMYYLQGDNDAALKYLLRAEGLKEGKSDFLTEAKQEIIKSR